MIVTLHCIDTGNRYKQCLTIKIKSTIMNEIIMVPDCNNRNNNSNIDSALLMSMMNNNGGFGNGNWMWIIFLFFLEPLMRNGLFGNGFGNGGFNGLGYTDNLINNAAGREMLMQAINGNGNAIQQLATTLNCDVNSIQQALCGLDKSLAQIGGQIGLSGQQVINSVQMGNQQLASQLASCCCDIRESVTKGNYDNQIATLNQTNQLQNSINFVNSSVERGITSNAYETQRQTCDILKAIDAQTTVINDKFCALEMRDMQRENQALRDQVNAFQLSASQQQQTQNIINQLQPVARPAYLTCSPYQAQVNPFNNGCGCNNGCQNSFWY